VLRIIRPYVARRHVRPRRPYKRHICPLEHNGNTIGAQNAMTTSPYAKHCHDIKAKKNVTPAYNAFTCSHVCAAQLISVQCATVSAGQPYNCATNDDRILLTIQNEPQVPATRGARTIYTIAQHPNRPRAQCYTQRQCSRH
jgi:hypothetical protein